MDDETVDRYLARIAAPRPPGPTSAALHDLQAAHLLAVPFENLSIHLGEMIVLDEKSICEKLLGRHRGGFCYELNGAFGCLLAALGFEVTFLAARVATAVGEVGPPFDHLVVRVDTDRSWLVDVGFGDHSTYPVALDDAGPHDDPGGTFGVVETPDGDIDVIRDGVAQYRVELRPRQWVDFVPMCWWHQTSPSSHFTQSLVCSLAIPGGRVTLSDRRLITTIAGVRSEKLLTSDDEVVAAYRDIFGIVVAHPPRLTAARSRPGGESELAGSA
jgi:N-hydroxyarylamine O-acetyltransferase